MNPGLNQILGVVCSADVADIDERHHHRISRRVVPPPRRTPGSRSVRAADRRPEHSGRAGEVHPVFADSVLMMADCFDLQLDEVKFSYELGACTKDVDSGWYTPARGVARRQLHQVPRHGERRAEGRDAPGVADDPAHRSRTGISRAATSLRSRATRASTTSTWYSRNPASTCRIRRTSRRSA